MTINGSTVSLPYSCCTTYGSSPVVSHVYLAANYRSAPVLLIFTSSYSLPIVTSGSPSAKIAIGSSSCALSSAGQVRR